MKRLRRNFAVQTSPPNGDDWLHEIKWDGYRMVATIVGGEVRLWSRNAIEWTAKVPKLARAIATLKLTNAQLDGEMVVMRDGRDDFNALQSRIGAQTGEPLAYMLFDLPHLDGESLRDDKRPDDLQEPAKMKTKANRATRATGRSAADTGAAVALTHPERIVFPDSGFTKADVAEYYRAVGKWLLPEVVDRPLSVVRCPDGAAAQCFFQKHAGRGWGPDIHGIDVHDKTSREKYFYINDERGLLELVQMNVLEFHPWGARNDDLDRADRIVLDLDPHASVAWSRVIAGARQVRKHLESVGLRSYVRTSGGKGLHVVVALDPPAPWDEVKAFAHAVASALAILDPGQFVDVAGDKNRTGKIFIDWLRNGRGSTSVASYSLRARPNAGVAMPLAWEALARVKSGDAFTIGNALRRIKRRSADPWVDIDSQRQSLPVIR